MAKKPGPKKRVKIRKRGNPPPTPLPPPPAYLAACAEMTILQRVRWATREILATNYDDEFCGRLMQLQRQFVPEIEKLLASKKDEDRALALDVGIKLAKIDVDRSRIHKDIVQNYLEALTTIEVARIQCRAEMNIVSTQDECDEYAHALVSNVEQKVRGDYAAQ